MTQSIEGGKKAAATNKLKYGDNFYHRIGAMGGAASRTGGFYANRELARRAGAVGGKKSRRRPSTKKAHKDFAEGFNEPSFIEKIKARIRNG